MKKRRKNPRLPRVAAGSEAFLAAFHQAALPAIFAVGALLCRAAHQSTQPAESSQQEIIEIVIAVISARFGPQAIALGNAGIRHSTPAFR